MHTSCTDTDELVGVVSLHTSMHTSCTDTDELVGVVSLHTKYAHIMY